MTMDLGAGCHEANQDQSLRRLAGRVLVATARLVYTMGSPLLRMGVCPARHGVHSLAIHTNFLVRKSVF